MQKFKSRLKYYLIGFSFGIVAVFFFFGERGCAWLPGNRVKNTIAEKEIVYGDSIKALMSCNNITNTQIYDLLNSSGDIDFSASKPREAIKKYVFKGADNLEVTFALHPDYSEIIALKSTCTVNMSNDHKQVVPLPASIISSIIESNTIIYYPEADCALNCYNISKDNLKDFHKNAKIDMSKSRPWISEAVKNNNPDNADKLYYLNGKINGKSYGVLYEIGENRTRIKRIIGEKDCGCN